MYVRSAIMEFQYITKIYYMQGHCKFFSEQLTLSQPDGQIMPTTVLRALPPPQIFRTCDSPDLANIEMEIKTNTE